MEMRVKRMPSHDVVSWDCHDAGPCEIRARPEGFGVSNRYNVKKYS
jgi:hypothetical protein